MEKEPKMSSAMLEIPCLPQSWLLSTNHSLSSRGLKLNICCQSSVTKNRIISWNSVAQFSLYFTSSNMTEFIWQQWEYRALYMLENMGLKKQTLTSFGISTSVINLVKQVRIYFVRLNPVLCFLIIELPPLQIMLILVSSLFPFA